MNRRRGPPAQLQELLDAGEYQALIRTLAHRTDLSGRESTILALSYLRSGQFDQARAPFAEALRAGDAEAQVEYGNLLRAQGQTQAAQAHLQTLLPSLDGELALRAQRWLGLCEEMNGVSGGLLRVQQALTGYLQLGDHDTAARISQLLAAMYATRGHVREAMRLLQGALPTLEAHQNRTPYLTALCSLADLQQEMMLYDEAAQTISRAETLAAATENTYNQTRLAYSAAFISLLRGDRQAQMRHLNRLLSLARSTGDNVMLEKGLCLLADHHSRLGEHSQALGCLVELYGLNPEVSSTIQLTEAMLARRRGDPDGAYRLFARVVERAEALDQPLMAARARLQMVYSLYLKRDYDRVREVLPEALTALLHFGTPGGPLDLRQDFPELSELFTYAEIDPDSAPILASLLGRAAERLGGAPDLLSASVQLELLVLGQETVLLDGSPLHFRLKRAVGVLFYLSLYPGRTRREIALDLFPDKEARVAGGYINSAISEIGQVAGPVVRQDGPHNAPTYALSRKVSVTSDYQLLLSRLAENNLPGALTVFRGPLLPSFEDSEWLTDLRLEVTRNARLTLGSALDEAEAQGDWTRAALLCTQGGRFDPQDAEFEVLLAERALRAARLSGQAGMIRRCELDLERLLHRLN
jgi:tetratricopeptide (TPR) repeat protein